MRLAFSIAPCGLAILVAIGVASPLFSQGYSASEAPSHMTLPEGLEATLVAAEPMVRQPVALEFDDRGRLWVVQYLQYPNPAGLKRVKVDRYSRTAYDKVPEPPPRGPRGADKITILEDTDGDGKIDSAKDFVNGLNLASSVAFGYDGVFVLQVPYLLFYPDRNRDDVPDGDPEVLLEGFGMQDAHAVANSLTWGPDGWLYGVEGSTVTSKIRGVEFQQGVWRYHPKTKAFELFAEGGGNSWGIDYDPQGNIFASTNFGPYIAIHAVQGAYYWKSFAKHGDLHNPFAYGYFDHMAHHNEMGGHVTDAGIIYQGGAIPLLEGKLVANNLLSHAIYFHDLIPKGSTFETRHAGVLLDSHDASFAPSDLTTGPDGALYVSDWNDKRTAHPDPDADWDKSTGRIYRIAAKGAMPAEKFDLAAKSDAELVALLDHKNAWFRRRARVLLASRGITDVSLQKQLKQQTLGPEPSANLLERFWTLNAVGLLDADAMREALQNPDAGIRRWAVRFTGDDPKLAKSLGGDLASLAGREENVFVLSQLAATAQRLADEPGLNLAAAVARRPASVSDPHIPLLAWWAVERHAIAKHDLVLKLFASKESFNSELGSETILPRLARRFAAANSREGDAGSVGLLERARSEKRLAVVLAGFDQGLRERGQEAKAEYLGDMYANYAEKNPTAAPPNSKPIEISPELKREIAAIWREAPDDLARLRLAVFAHEKGAIERAIQLEGDPSKSDSERLGLIEILAAAPDAEAQRLLLGLAVSDEKAPIRGAALDALRGHLDDSANSALLAAYAKAAPALQAKMRILLLSRKEGARLLLRAVDSGAIADTELQPTQLRSAALYDDAEMNGIIKKHWGAISEGTPEEKLATARRLNNDIRAFKGNPEHGHEVFKKTCIQCHKLFGEGGAVGPDLTQSNRADTDYLLLSLVDPSAVIRKEYMGSIIEMKDGGTLTGIITARPPGAITLANADDQAINIPMERVREIRESAVSVMPEDLPTSLKPDELRDLFSYLQSDPPSESQKTGKTKGGH